jgi:hypothetical protein
LAEYFLADLPHNRDTADLPHNRDTISELADRIQGTIEDYFQFELELKNSNAVALGKLGGQSKSPAKAEAARKNGKLGGRPKKST